MLQAGILVPVTDATPWINMFCPSRKQGQTVTAKDMNLS